MINPELNSFLEVWDNKWADLPPNADAAARRCHFEAIARDMRLPSPLDVDCDSVHLINSEAGKVRVRVFRYKSDASQPCLIYMHGGAWMQGSPETHWDITSRIASFNKQTVISIDYALAPEHPFPAAITQCAAVIEWAFKNDVDLKINIEKVSIGGDSAGANLAAALCIMFRDAPEKLNAQLLVYPACDFDRARPSYTENADGPLIKTQGMEFINRMYSPDEKELETNPLVAPLVASDHSNLPAAFIAVAEHDPLRDSGIAYAKALIKAGVPVELDSGNGLIHGYLRAMEYCGGSMDKLKKMSAWLKEVNGK